MLSNSQMTEKVKELKPYCEEEMEPLMLFLGCQVEV